MSSFQKEQSTGASNSASGLAISGGLFALLSDDIVLNILASLESDPRDWARLACVSTRLACLVRNVCCRAKCFRSLPCLASELAEIHPAGPPGGWGALLKISVCCPGLLGSGVLLQSSDFGLEREIGPDENYLRCSPSRAHPPATVDATAHSPSPSECWSLFDDLYFDTIYDVSETHAPLTENENANEREEATDEMPITSSPDSSKRRRTNFVGPVKAHLASGSWNLSKEQGSKLLATRFRGDSLYICDWPGCIHAEEKRDYMLFRGVFKNFKRSRVWRTINDTNRSTIELSCAFCACKEIWDLHSAFCLRTVFGFHDDGEPVVRAYVCENGHVSGAWTDLPMQS